MINFFALVAPRQAAINVAFIFRKIISQTTLDGKTKKLLLVLNKIGDTHARKNVLFYSAPYFWMSLCDDNIWSC